MSRRGGLWVVSPSPLTFMHSLISWDFWGSHLWFHNNDIEIPVQYKAVGLFAGTSL